MMPLQATLPRDMTSQGGGGGKAVHPAVQCGRGLATASAGVGGCWVWLFLLPVSMEILHPSLQLALVLVNPAWPVELQEESCSSLLFHQSITSLPRGDLAYSFGHQISWGLWVGVSMKRSRMEG